MLKLLSTVLLFLVVSCSPDTNNNTKNTTPTSDDTPVNAIDSSEISRLDEAGVLEADTASESDEISDETPNEIKTAENEQIRTNEIQEVKEIVQKPIASISFDNNIHDFGHVIEGEWVTEEFSFTNVGTAPLIIKKALASCGCTSPEYPEEPILPGENGTVKVVFDSKSRLGKQDKYITIVTNGDPPSQIIRLQGTVYTE